MANNKRLIAKINFPDGKIIIVDNNLLSVEFGALDRGSLTDVIDWGIYANRGSLSFIDNIGYFNNANINSSQIKNAKVQIYLKKNEEKLLATFDVADTNFDDATRQVDIELQSHLLSWQNIYTEKSYWYSSKMSYSVFEEIFNDLGVEIYAPEYSSWAKMRLSGVYVPVNTKLWDFALSFCQVEMVRIFENANGSAKILPISKTPIIVDINNVINFSNSNFVSIPNATIDVTNRSVFTNRVYSETITSLNLTEILLVGDLKNNVYTDESLTVTFSDWKTIATMEYRTVKIEKTFNLPYKVFNASLGTLGNQQTLQNGATTAEHITLPITSSNISTSTDHQSLIISFEFQFHARTKNLTTGSVTKETIIDRVRFWGGGEFFEDDGYITYKYTTLKNSSYQKISSSNLLTKSSSVYGEQQYAYEHILNAVKSKYSQGIDCVECECLLNDYIDEMGNVALRGNELEHFNSTNYNIVIPYTVSGTTRKPLRTNLDGTPKQFRVIGISYSYAGHLTQKLHLQEER